jgi:hypothetical protein
MKRGKRCAHEKNEVNTSIAYTQCGGEDIRVNRQGKSIGDQEAHQHSSSIYLHLCWTPNLRDYGIFVNVT